MRALWLAGLVACGYPELPPIDEGPACPANCGESGQDDCCASEMVPGNSFFRSFDPATDGMFSNMNFPATVENFRFDTYEVSVGRFRQFVESGLGTQEDPPVAGDGEHSGIANSGWLSSFTANLPADTASLVASLHCDPDIETWTDAPGNNEAQPINCVSWFVAFAFCIYDGGYLPTEAEWNFAASGGPQQRAFPWSNPPSATDVDCSFANYRIDVPSGMQCKQGTTIVGSQSPKGDSLFGQADLAGNVWEWVLDGFADPYADMNCTNCANLTDVGSRVFRGGGFSFLANNLRTSFRNFVIPTSRQNFLGMRCARRP